MIIEGDRDKGLGVAASPPLCRPSGEAAKEASSAKPAFANASAWTPGPWEALRAVHSDSWRIRTAGTQLELAEAYPEDDETRFPVEANARLIAASPDLYEALDEALAFIAAWAGAYKAEHKLADIHPNHKAAIEKTQAALRKARGQP